MREGSRIPIREKRENGRGLISGRAVFLFAFWVLFLSQKKGGGLGVSFSFGLCFFLLPLGSQQRASENKRK